MNSFNTIFFLLIIVCYSNVLLAQQEHETIPTEANKCYAYLEAIMLAQKHDDCQTIMAVFRQNQRSNKLKEEHYEGLAVLGNAMIERKMKRYNYFRHLLAVVNTFAEREDLSSRYFEQWIHISKQILSNQAINKVVTFEEYLGWSSNFWEQGDIYNPNKSSHKWQATSQNFSMRYDEGIFALHYDETELICYQKKDSLKISAATGVYYPLEERWEGSAGVVKWEKRDAYALLDSYVISTKSIAYQADAAKLFDERLSATAIDGVLHDRIANRQSLALVYPKFESKANDIALNHLGEGLTFIGKLELLGNRLKGTNVEGLKALFVIKDEHEKVLVRAESQGFELNRVGGVLSSDCKVELYIYQKDGWIDSISHPSLEFAYNIAAKTLTLNRGEGHLANFCYANSLQKMNLKTNRLTWAIDSNQILLGDNRQNLEMYSDYFFDESLVEAYQGIGNSNPLVQMGVYGKKIAESTQNPLFEPWKRFFKAEDLAILLDKRMEQIALMTSSEIDNIAGNRNWKIIQRKQDFRDFAKGFPQLFKYGAIDVSNLVDLIPNPSFDEKLTLPLYLQMETDGFIDYNRIDGTVRLRKKLFHYLASMNTKQIDYDFDKIKILSLPSNHNQTGGNALLDLTSKKIETYGVRHIMLSESQGVFAHPYGAVGMLPDRNINFNGQLAGGYCNFTGSDFNFIYDNFQVEMEQIHKMDFFIFKRAQLGAEHGRLSGRFTAERALDKTGVPSNERVAIKSTIEDAQGLLLIDVPSNKSGRQETDKIYPSFESTHRARVYYDKRNRLGEGVYDRSDFYFELKPFILNGLDNLEPEQLNFEGTLFSAGIFEPLEERLELLFHDLSLGFETQTRGTAANPIYLRKTAQGKGAFAGTLGISNEGFLGNGRLNYLGASFSADYLEFLPERCQVPEAATFDLLPSSSPTNFPAVKGKMVQIDWLPYLDSMYIKTALAEGFPFVFFDEHQYQLEGSLSLTPNALRGKGTFDWDNAVLESNPGGDYIFGTKSIHSKSAAVILKSQTEQFGFENENVSLSIDFEKQVADFIANEVDLVTVLPYNAYETSLDKFHWDMATNHVFMEAANQKKGFFWAMEGALDSLFFEGMKADYDLNNGLLKIDGVNQIRVADAFVFPSEQHIEIEGSSKIKPLEKARLLIDTLHQKFLIRNASVQILSRNEYKAAGVLDYKLPNFRSQTIYYPNVESRLIGPNQYVSIGNASLADSAQFFLSQGLRFKGNVRVQGNLPRLDFKGFSRLSSKVIDSNNWFETQASVDPNNVYINIDKPSNEKGNILETGIYLSMDSMHLYPCILNTPQDLNSRNIFSVGGILRYENDSFIFGDSAAVLGNGMGQKMTVFEKTSKVEALGAFDFEKGFEGANLPNLTLDFVGNLSFYLNKENSYVFSTSSLIDFYLPTALSHIIYNDLTQNPSLVDKVLYSSVKNQNLKAHLKHYILDERDVEKRWKKVEDDERLLLPNASKTAFFFVNNDLVWNEKTASFCTKGRRLQLASLGGKHAGQQLKGHLEILPDANRGDALTFYLVSPMGDWYYFSLQNGILKTVSSNPDYNNAFVGLKNKHRRIETENGNYLEMILTTPSDYSNFKNKMM